MTIPSPTSPPSSDNTGNSNNNNNNNDGDDDDDDDDDGDDDGGTGSSSNSNSGGGYGLGSGSGSPAFDYQSAEYFREIHGILAAVAIVGLFPLGAVLVRVVPGRFAWLVHALTQVVGYITFVAAAVLGLYLVSLVKIGGGRNGSGSGSLVSLKNNLLFISILSSPGFNPIYFVWLDCPLVSVSVLLSTCLSILFVMGFPLSPNRHKYPCPVLSYLDLSGQYTIQCLIMFPCLHIK